MTAEPFVIYMLVDPRDYRPYYVGETRDRIKRHRYHCENTARNTAVARRNQAIIKSGRKPLMIVLEEAENEVSALIKEIFWIELFMSKGMDLCNRENQAYLYERLNELMTETRIEAKPRRRRPKGRETKKKVN